MVNLMPSMVLDEDVVARLWITQDGCLAYLMGEDAEANSVLLNPCDGTVVGALEAGTLPLRDALVGPHMRLIRQGHDGTQTVRSVTEADVPCLPMPGIFLRLGSGSVG